jgi:HEAT repeat protein
VQIGIPAVVPLIGVMKESSYKLRRDAIIALSTINDARIEKVLVRALKDAAPEVRIAAIDALRVSIGKQAMEPITLALQDENSEVRMAAVDALKKIGDERAAASIIAMLKNIKQKERNTGEQIAAMETLGSFGGEPVLEILAEMLKSDIPVVQDAAADILDDLGWTPDTEEHHADYCVIRSQWQQCVAIGAEAVKPLIGMIGRNNSAIEALGQIGDARATKPILQKLESGDWETRKTAALALLLIAKKNPDAAIVDNALIKKIKTAHRDSKESWSDDCNTYSNHTDTGIGLNVKL